MHWIYLIHEFHNLSWITEINDFYNDILIYWDAPVWEQSATTTLPETKSDCRWMLCKGIDKNPPPKPLTITSESWADFSLKDKTSWRITDWKAPVSLQILIACLCSGSEDRHTKPSIKNYEPANSPFLHSTFSDGTFASEDDRGRLGTGELTNTTVFVDLCFLLRTGQSRIRWPVFLQ